MSLLGTMNRMGGVASVRALKEKGFSEGMLRGAVRSGLVWRIRSGWLATPGAPADVAQAVALGGRLGCASAARHLGAWVLEEPARIHVAIPRHAGRASAHRSGSVIAHWQSENWAPRESPIEAPRSIALQVADCLPSELAIATIDSLINLRLLSIGEARAALTDDRTRRLDVARQLDGASQSGLESIIRVRLRRLGLPVRSQVEIAGVGRVDLVVGERLVIETDGLEWHNDPAAVARDYARDLRLVLLGYYVIRLSYEQILYDWPLSELSIREAVARGEHLAR